MCTEARHAVTAVRHEVLRKGVCTMFKLGFTRQSTNLRMLGEKRTQARPRPSHHHRHHQPLGKSKQCINNASPLPGVFRRSERSKATTMKMKNAPARRREINKNKEYLPGREMSLCDVVVPKRNRESCLRFPSFLSLRTQRRVNCVDSTRISAQSSS